MARRKGGKSKGYQSKGQRRNVSRWSRNASRAENRANPSPQAIAQRAAYRRTIITSPSDPDFFQELDVASTEFPEKSKELEARLIKYSAFA